jgi:hypothetical protein
MSDTDSFIEEVNEEVRRDRLYLMLRRYGWIAASVIILIVGGAAFSEYRKAQTRKQAENLGDAMLAAMAVPESEGRAAALADIKPGSPESVAVLRLLTASAQTEAGETAAATETLDGLALDGDVPAIYREIAQFKSLTLQGAEAAIEDRRQAFEAMAQPGRTLRLLASEQLALLDIEAGDGGAAITRYQSILADAEVTSELQQRALQVIVALGGEPDLDNAPALSETQGATSDN